MMTHSLYRSQESAPSEAILEDSCSFRTRLKTPKSRPERGRNLTGKPPGTTYPQVVMTQNHRMFHELRGYLFCRPPAGIDSFDSFSIFELVDSLLTVAIFQHLRVARPLARLLLCRDCDGSIAERELANFH
jgi:hypothetical protein